jgi:Ca2+-binding RTX toxin-like protein
MVDRVQFMTRGVAQSRRASQVTREGTPNEIGGGPGNDRLVGGAGRDKLLGGDGDDIHDADDGVRDSVTCGNGFDSVVRDPFDAVWSTCENR